MRQRKVYAHTRDPRSGKRVLAHRWIAEQSLGRPLLPREVVHHKDGNSLNNDPSNLIVLPSQRVHAHAEFHLRRVRSGMPSLFPEFFQVIPSDTWGTLFAHVLVWQGQEPPLPQKVEAKPQQSSSTQPTLFPPPQERSLTPLLPEIESGVCLVGELQQTLDWPAIPARCLLSLLGANGAKGERVLQCSKSVLLSRAAWAWAISCRRLPP